MEKTPPCRFCNALKIYNDQTKIAETKEGVLYLGGKLVSDVELIDLMAEVELVRKFDLWKLITSTITAQAVNLGIKNAKDFDGTIFAKAMLHNVGIMEGLLLAIEQEKRRRIKK